jgi:RNA polymerase sigma-70 factor (ECF subfamily)
VRHHEPLVHLSDEQLFEGIRRGDDAAFGTLVRRYERELYGYLCRYLSDPHLADDVFQNTFLQLFIKVGQFEAGRSVRPWLYAIATNQAIDAMRKQGRHPTVSLDCQSVHSAEGEVHSLGELLEGDSLGPDAVTELEDRRARTRLCVDRLPEFLRQVVLLAYFQSLKYREIAEILDIPVGTVKSRLHTALNKLQEFSEQLDGEEVVADLSAP